MARRRTMLLAGVAAAAVVAGTTGGIYAATQLGPTERERSRAATDRPCTRPYVQVEASEADKPELRLQSVGRAVQPTTIAVDPRGVAPALLGQREGAVRIVGDDGRITGDVVLELDDTSDHGDGGLLAMVYDPVEPWLYVWRTVTDQDDVLTAYPLDETGRPRQDGEVELLRSGHPSSEQHHGGGLAFGPDGYLYLGIGDGGGLGDPRGNAQDPAQVLGKVLRIDPTPGAADPYAVPPDNPFVGRDGWRPEIWASGVRNPYRLTFDAATDDLWLGDVGQSCWEELDRLRPDDGGANLGWDHREGTVEFQGGDVPGREVLPQHAYSHLGGWCALVAGPVVRGPALPDLDGWLLHTDYCRGRIVALDVDAAPGDPERLVDTGLRVENPLAIALGPDGLPWVLTEAGDVQRIVVPPSGGD
jgi:glucose/arabinose dehydrogenase